MKNKMKTFVLAATVAMALAALPAAASAGEPEIHCGGAVCGAFTTTSGATALSVANGTTINCTSTTGAGQYTTKKTGTVALMYHGCFTPTFFNTACTSPGQPVGTIKTNSSVFHNIYESVGKTTPGILTTAPAIPLTFTCGGFVHVEVTGSIIGDLESPGCGGSSKELKLSLAATAHGQQQYKQVTTTGTIFDLDVKLNGGAAQTAAVTGTGTMNFGAAATITCV